MDVVVVITAVFIVMTVASAATFGSLTFGFRQSVSIRLEIILAFVPLPHPPLKYHFKEYNAETDGDYDGGDDRGGNGENKPLLDLGGGGRAAVSKRLVWEYPRRSLVLGHKRGPGGNSRKDRI